MNFGSRERSILMALSEDSRMSISRLSNRASCSPITLKKIINRMTEELGIRFIIEFDESLISRLERHILTIKFAKKPDIPFIKEFFNIDKHAQDVYLTDGNFDLLVYAMANNPVDYTIWETQLASELSSYLPSLRSSEYVTSQFGFMPLVNDFIDELGKEYKVDESDRALLKLLNENSRMSYRELAERSGLKDDTVRYRVFNLLKKNKIIRRFTIAVQRPPQGYTSIAYFANYRFTQRTTSESFANIRAHFMKTDENAPLLNSFPLIAPISGSFRSFGISLFPSKSEAFANTIRKQRAVYRNDKLELRYAEIKEAIKGFKPFRNLEMKSNYKIIWR